MYAAYPPSTVYPVNSAFSHRFSFPERQYSQRPSVRCSQGTPTRVSSGYLSAPLPCSSTFPITWCPGTTGDRRDGSSPSTTCRSVRQTPQTLTRIKISPGPGDGLGASLHCNGFNSTGPGESSAQACMAVPPMKRRLQLLSALVQTPTELTMMDRCPDSYPRKSCSKVDTLTRKSWSFACVGI